MFKQTFELIQAIRNLNSRKHCRRKNIREKKKKKKKQSMSHYQKVMIKIATLLPRKMRRAFLHPAGPTTIFFWAPTMKWGLVIAGIGDLNRPPEMISLGQTASLMLTGAIWSRYSLVITPKNWNLFGVNVFVFATGAYNFFKGCIYNIDQMDRPT